MLVKTREESWGRLAGKIQMLGNELSILCEEVLTLQKYYEMKLVTAVKPDELQVKGLDGKSSEYQDYPERLLRLKDVLKVLNISKSTFWAGIKSGRYPAPTYVLGPKIPTWRQSAILHLVLSQNPTEDIR